MSQRRRTQRRIRWDRVCGAGAALLLLLVILILIIRSAGGNHGELRWEADLDGDGHKEQIVLDLAALEQSGTAAPQIESDAGTVIGALSNVGITPAEYRTYALVETDQGSHLLEYATVRTSSAVNYSYRFWNLAGGVLTPEQPAALTLALPDAAAASDNDIAAAEAYVTQLNALMEHAEILISTDADSVLPNLTDTAGKQLLQGIRAVFAAGSADRTKVTEAANGTFVETKRTLTYTETLKALDLAYAANADYDSTAPLTARLQYGNHALARQRALNLAAASAAAGAVPEILTEAQTADGKWEFTVVLRGQTGADGQDAQVHIVDDSPQTVQQPAQTGTPVTQSAETVVTQQSGATLLTQTETTTSQTTAATTTQEQQTEAAIHGQKEIYLTFDDGPCDNTPEVLDILDKYGAKATFFTVGMFVDRFPEYAAETVRRGNLIACHSYTHEFDRCYATVDAFINEEQQWENAVTNACGKLPERICLRFPGGSTTHYADAVRDGIQERLRSMNICWFDWNAGDNDKWPAGNTDNLPETEYYLKSYRECMQWFKETPETPVVFLLHDTEYGTVQVLPEILQDLIDRGYTFKTLDQHPDWG